ncbi:MAG: hypothetical protein IJD82_07915 [Clostridia bacterium]|nr:hypothetical protein [Clostridia bacterium]
MKNKTILALLLLLGVLATGCANVVMPSPVPDSDESQTVSDRIEQAVSILPSTSEFHGEKLIVMTDEPSIFVGNEEEAGMISGALADRDEMIATLYGMELQVKQLDAEAVLQAMHAASVSGTAEADLLCYSAETTYLLYAAGLLSDLTELPYFDLSTACYDENVATSLQTGQSVYFLPDPSAHAYGDSYVLFYDRALVKGAGLALPESRVIAGTWDIGTLQTYAETIAAVVMGKTSFDLQKDVFGYSSQDNATVLPYLLWRAQGYELFDNPASGAMQFAYTPILDTLKAQHQPLRAFFDSNSRYPLDGSDAYAAFRDGRLGFLVAELDYIKELYTDAEREYGVLPLPKANGTNGGYVCPVKTTGRVLSVPKLVRSRARCGVGLSVLCVAGGAVLHEAEKQTYINLYSRDNDQTCMLEMILDASVFDFAMLFAPHEESVYWLSTRMMTDVTLGDSQFDSFVAQYGEKFGEYAVENLS